MKSPWDTDFFNNFATFCSARPMGKTLSGRRMKRESGGNPGQSRCCELIVRFVSNLKPLPYIIIRWEGQQAGVSQKTCKT